jgi:hypothetical protein
MSFDPNDIARFLTEDPDFIITEGYCAACGGWDQKQGGSGHKARCKIGQPGTPITREEGHEGTDAITGEPLKNFDPSVVGGMKPGSQIPYPIQQKPAATQASNQPAGPPTTPLPPGATQWWNSSSNPSYPHWRPYFPPTGNPKQHARQTAPLVAPPAKLRPALITHQETKCASCGTRPDKPRYGQAGYTPKHGDPCPDQCGGTLASTRKQIRVDHCVEGNTRQGLNPDIIWCGVGPTTGRITTAKTLPKSGDSFRYLPDFVTTKRIPGIGSQTKWPTGNRPFRPTYYESAHKFKKTMTMHRRNVANIRWL